MKKPSKTWMSWSTGKDSAFALHKLMMGTEFLVTGLLTTIAETQRRVSMHEVREELLERQIMELGLPLYRVAIPTPCPNDIYASHMRIALDNAASQGVTHVAFGDLFLEELRTFRELRLLETGIKPIFPLWKQPTSLVAKEMIASGIKAIITCIDTRVLPPTFLGREYDERFIADLPSHVDPCGENGEFHSFVYASPLFPRSIAVNIGEQFERDGFVFADLKAA